MAETPTDRRSITLPVELIREGNSSFIRDADGRLVCAANGAAIGCAIVAALNGQPRAVEPAAVLRELLDMAPTDAAPGGARQENGSLRTALRDVLDAWDADANDPEWDTRFEGAIERARVLVGQERGGA